MLFKNNLDIKVMTSSTRIKIIKAIISQSSCKLRVVTMIKYLNSEMRNFAISFFNFIT